MSKADLPPKELARPDRRLALLTSYHNHTRWSDGRATVAETVVSARNQGLDEVGISDHFVLHPAGWTPSWAMRPDRLSDYVADVRAAGDGRATRVRLGLEVDWFPEHADVIAARLGEHEFDYLIGSIHVIDDFALDASPAPWDALPEEETNELNRRYWRKLTDMARSRLFDVVGHLDLTKKFGHRPTADLTEEIDGALDAIADAGMAVELNTSGWEKPCTEPYPSDALLRACRSREIPALVTADAHDPAHLCHDFARGRDRLREAGYREVVVFAGRRRAFVPLRV